SKARSMGSVLHYGEQGQGALYPDETTDTWTFAARAGDAVRLSVEAQDQFLKPTVELRTPDGKLLSSAVAPDSDKRAVAGLDNFTIPASGIYVITITGGTTNTTGSYLLSLDYTP